MSLVKLSAKKTASQRTKNRIKENGPIFELKDVTNSTLLFDGDPGLLLLSKKTNWFGWLPEKELNWEYYNDTNWITSFTIPFKRTFFR